MRPTHAGRIVMGCCTLVLFGSTVPTLAYKPEDPVVVGMVNRAANYVGTNHGRAGGLEDTLGGKCLCALAVYKATQNPSHPLVAKALTECRAAMAPGYSAGGHDNYSYGIALIFLGEIDAQLYKAEIQGILQKVYAVQKPHGGWGYEERPSGDTSQTQYAVLAMWLADRQNIEVPQKAVEDVCNWLIRTQYPEGAYGYQERDGRRTPSMGAAGIGSLYVCGELLGFIQKPLAKRKEGLPPAFKPVLTPEELAAQARKAKTTRVSKSAWQQAVSKGNNWFGANYALENPNQQAYYMYAVERYWAFRELATKSAQKEPAWYNEGVEYLRTHQASDGSWGSSAGVRPLKSMDGPVIDTAFCMLFLMRTSQKTVTKLVIEQGALRGGKDLSQLGDLANARVTSSGKVVAPTVDKPVKDVLAMLEDDSEEAPELGDGTMVLKLSSDPKERSLEIGRLRRMAINGKYAARLAAVKTLGSARNLDSAPSLIFALSDPDHRVALAARDALRFMSRRVQGFGFETDKERQKEDYRWKAAQEKWTDWLLSVKPDAELLE